MPNRTWVVEPTKPIPVNNDQILILDSGDSDLNKLVTLGSLPGTEFFGPWTANHDAGGFVLDNLLSITDASLNDILRFSSIGPTAVNFMLIANSATTNAPFILATGTDTDVDLELLAKGDGTVQFEADATRAGLNLGSFTADPSTAVNGDVYYNSTANELRVRINSVWVTIGSGEFFGPWTANHDAGGFVLDNLLEISDVNINPILRFSSAGASAVNFIILSNAVTTNSPFILAAGSDTNVDLTLFGKGSGTVSLGSNLDAVGFDLLNVGILESDATNLATVGSIRFGNEERIAWRNAANNNNISIRVANSDTINFQINGPTAFRFNETEFDTVGKQIVNVAYFESDATNPATIGALRLGNTEFLAWRNAANSDNITMRATGTDTIVIGINSVNEFRLNATEVDVVSKPITNFTFLESDATNPAQAGVIRIGNTEFIAARNAANTQNGTLSLNASDDWVFTIAAAARFTIAQTLIDAHGNSIDNVSFLNTADATTATVGAIRLGNGEFIGWRDSGDTAEGTLTFDASDDFVFNVAAGGRFAVSERGSRNLASRHQGAKGANVASPAGGILTLGIDGNVFDITGTNTINEITPTSWQAGSIIDLQFDGVLTVTNNSGGTNDILLGDGANFTTAAGDVLTLFYNGVDWQEVSRSTVGGGGGGEFLGPWTADHDAGGFKLEDLLEITDANTNPIWRFASAGASAENFINITNSVSGIGPSMLATGPIDGDVDFNINTKGNGIVFFPRIASIVAGSPAADGFLRLGNNEIVAWRNAGDTTDATITLNASDDFVFTIAGSAQFTVNETEVDVHGNNLNNVSSFTSNATNPSTAGAIRLGNAELITWRNAGNTANHSITFNGTDNFFVSSDGEPDYEFDAIFFDINQRDIIGIDGLSDVNDNIAIQFVATASAVNGIEITNAITANSPTIGVRGPETNIDLTLIGKGSGTVSLGSNLDAVGFDLLNVGFLQSDATNPATVGALRLGNAEIIAFRNAANTDNETLILNASDDFVFTIESAERFTIRSNQIDVHTNRVVNVLSYAFSGADALDIITADANGIEYEVVGGDDHEFFVNGTEQLQITETEINLLNNNLLMSGGFAQLTEITPPAAPAANTGRIYVADDGGVTTPFFRDDTDIINLRRSKCLIAGGFNTNNISADNYSSWNPFTAPGGGFDGEAMSFGKDGILSEMYFTISTNTAGVAITFNFQTAAATNGNQTVTIPSNTTGTFVDITNTDATTLGDIQAFRVDANAPGDATFVLLAAGIYLTTDEA